MRGKGNTEDIFALRALADLGNFELLFEILMDER